MPIGGGGGGVIAKFKNNFNPLLNSRILPNLSLVGSHKFSTIANCTCYYLKLLLAGRNEPELVGIFAEIVGKRSQAFLLKFTSFFGFFSWDQKFVAQIEVNL